MDKTNILIGLLILLITILSVFLYVYFQEGTTCMNNPTGFGLKHLSDYYHEDITCMCSHGLTINATATKIQPILDVRR